MFYGKRPDFSCIERLIGQNTQFIQRVNVKKFSIENLLLSLLIFDLIEMIKARI